ncbi:WXG100 family type VII secretion target [Nocardia sp. NBC_00416]|uniref:WXG100 family type VII secretion target n=1 Tax=Nocardia sp. NBC_00416 TaxID=2975991 RepID=UPI002E1B504F
MRELPRGGMRGVHYRVDPDYAPTVEVFDNLTHQEIHAGVALMDPSVLQTGGQAWQGAATGLTDAVDRAHTEIQGAIADGWRGAAAGVAVAAVRDFESAGRQLADVLATVGQRLRRAGDAAETLRAGVPEPSGAEPDLAAALLDPRTATDNVAVVRAADDDRADVVRVMESVYNGAFVPTGAQVPAFPDLPDSTSAAAPAAVLPPVTVAPVADTAAGQNPAHPQPVAVAVPDEQTDPPRPAAAAATGTGQQVLTGAVPDGAGTTPEAPPETTVAGTAQPPAAPAAAAPAAAAGVTGVAPASSAPAASVPVFAAPVRPAGSGGDQERTRDEQQRHSGGEAVTGMGAGAIGGMLGGAMAADTVRSGAPVAPVRADRAEPDEDELHFTDEELTYLEPGDPAGPLIGALDPTTPPVLGEWTEAE